MISRRDRIEEERKDFNEWKRSICCYGDPEYGKDEWNIIMDGPKDSPYAGGKFKIRINFPEGYPQDKPLFEFLTPIIHINISGTYICNDVFKNYNSDTSIIDILTNIFMMLTSPNEESPFPTYINLFKDDYESYLEKARQYTKDYAI